MFKAFEFCLPTNEAKVPAGPEWLHEIKYDGLSAHHGSWPPGGMGAAGARPCRITIDNAGDPIAAQKHGPECDTHTRSRQPQP
jgi:hypothetical protein